MLDLTKKILGVISFLTFTLCLMFTVGIARGQISPPILWFDNGTQIELNDATFPIRVPALGGGGTLCVQTDNDGDLSAAAAACGTGAGADNDWIGGENSMYSSTTADTIGIGTTTPATTLDIWGNLQVATSSASPMLYVDSGTGYVGIGTAAPTSLLHVAGILKVGDIDPLSDKAYDLGNTSRYFEKTYTQLLYLNPTANFSGAASGLIGVNGDIVPISDSSDDLGATAEYWAETYTDKLYLNSSATLDGSAAGIVALTGDLTVSGNATSVDSYATNFGINSEYFNDLTGTGLTNTNNALTLNITGGTGIAFSNPTVSFDCSEVEGEGIDCVGEAVTLNATPTVAYWETQQTARTADDLSDNDIDALQNVNAMSEALGDILYYGENGWTNMATGTADQVFKISATTGYPNWDTDATGAGVADTDWLMGDNLIYSSTTAELIGIGTANPSARLTVFGGDIEVSDGTATSTISNGSIILDFGLEAATATIATITGALVGNADTATALFGDPSDCTSGDDVADTIAASGNLSCTTISDTHMTSEDFGEFTCDSTEDGCTLNAESQGLTELSDVTLDGPNDAEILIYQASPASDWIDVAVSGDCTIDNTGAMSCSSGAFTTTTVDHWFTTKDSDDLSEGSTNLYQDGELTAWIDDVTLGASGALTIPSGQNFLIGTVQWNSSDEIDGTKIKDADYGDVVIDAGGDWQVSEATALAANGGNCNAGEYPLGVDASGAIESCTDATTEINTVVNGLGGTNLTCAAQSCSVDDSFLLNTGDIATGSTTHETLNVANHFVVEGNATTSGEFVVGEDSATPIPGCIMNCDSDGGGYSYGVTLNGVITWSSADPGCAASSTLQLGICP